MTEGAGAEIYSTVGANGIANGGVSAEKVWQRACVREMGAGS